MVSKSMESKNQQCGWMKKSSVRGVVGLLVGALALPAVGGNFSITPVRIFMEPKDRAVAVTVTNEGDDELVMQADIYTWKQKPDGKDDLVLSEDLFLAPPIIKLAPKARQVVRLARVNTTPSNDQITYRLIVREIPEAKPVKDKVALQIALAFSMPVFITPRNAKRQVHCTIERATADTVRAVCENTGNAYAYPTGFMLTSSNGQPLVSVDPGGGYILPGAKRSFDLKRNEGKITSGKAALEVPFDDGTKERYEVTIAE
jgi:fimbrial chaperone protein